MEELNNSEEKKAIAIKREEDGTLRVVAYGTGSEAEAIIEKARECDIEVVRDSEEIKRVMGSGEAIPDRIYGLISEIMMFVTELDEAWVEKDFEGREAPSKEL